MRRKPSYDDIKAKLKDYLMETYDIKPSLAERAVNKMFIVVTDYIAQEEQKESEQH